MFEVSDKADRMLAHDLLDIKETMGRCRVLRGDRRREVGKLSYLRERGQMRALGVQIQSLTQEREMITSPRVSFV
jgi:hypothetical protein